jgi:glyoxylase-like metal-dependent hydrolase (beta-lactamase superfamily II)
LLRLLGGCGAWPAAGQACSGYLIEHDGFRLLVDPGYATVPQLLRHLPAAGVDAVLVSHGHPDHCADLNPLLRARRLEAPSPAPAHRDRQGRARSSSRAVHRWTAQHHRFHRLGGS